MMTKKLIQTLKVYKIGQQQNLSKKKKKGQQKVSSVLFFFLENRSLVSECCVELFGSNL